MPSDAPMLPYDRLVEKAVTQHVPIRAMIELTRRCNLRCMHCYLVPLSSPELSGAEVKQVIQDLANLGTIILTFTGGEVLLRNDFFELCWHARQLGFALHIKTNGTLLDAAACEEIGRLDPVKVDISIYHGRPEVHDKVTGLEGSHAASMRAVESLVTCHVPVFINTVLMRENGGSYREIRELAESVGAGFQIDPVVLVKTNGSKTTTRCRADDSCLAELMRDMYADYVELVGAGPSMDERSEARPCYAGSTNVVIVADGIVHPCAVLSLDCGNIRNNSLRRIWRTSRELSQVRDLRVTHATACRECDLYLYCRRCMGLAYLEDGDLCGCSSEAKRQATVYRTVAEAAVDQSKSV